MNFFACAAVALVTCKTGCELALLFVARRRAKELQAGPAPAEVSGVFESDADFRRAMDYSAAKLRDGFFAEIFSCVVTLALLAGGAAALLRILSGNGADTFVGETLAAIGFILVIGLADIPADLRATFGTETEFGFNRTTPPLWLADKLKGAVVGFTLGFALLAPCAWFVGAMPDTWWLCAWLAFCIFQIAAAGLLVPALLPLFNKLTPLQDGDLKNRLLKLAGRADFPSSAVLVMDGSKRSGHANAFFAGFGRARRIVLFDTLVEQLTTEELEAVLAHEIGHWKRGHILKAGAKGMLFSLPVFALAGVLSHRPELARALGFTTPESALTPFSVLVALGALLLPAALYWLAPLTNRRSRLNEYEADEYAAELTGGPRALILALRKLHRTNAGNPLPHPAFALFHHSHPTLPERERALTA